MGVGTVGTDCLVLRVQRTANADRGGFLADGQVHRAAHLLFGVMAGDGFFSTAYQQHARQPGQGLFAIHDQMKLMCGTDWLIRRSR